MFGFGFALRIECGKPMSDCVISDSKLSAEIVDSSHTLFYFAFKRFPTSVIKSPGKQEKYF